MIRRQLGQALTVIALASAALSTEPVHAQKPSPNTTPGTVTAAPCHTPRQDGLHERTRRPAPGRRDPRRRPDRIHAGLLPARPQDAAAAPRRPPHIPREDHTRQQRLLQQCRVSPSRLGIRKLFDHRQSSARNEDWVHAPQSSGAFRPRPCPVSRNILRRDCGRHEQQPVGGSLHRFRNRCRLRPDTHTHTELTRPIIDGRGFFSPRRDRPHTRPPAGQVHDEQAQVSKRLHPNYAREPKRFSPRKSILCIHTPTGTPRSQEATTITAAGIKHGNQRVTSRDLAAV